MTESNIEKVDPSRPAPRAAAKGRSRASKIPDGAKVPQDHQPAKADVVEPKPVAVTWGTKAGEPNEDGTPGERVPAVYMIDPNHFDDIEFMEAMIDMDAARTDGARTAFAYQGLRTLLGPEQLDQYKDNERDPATGRTSFSGSIPFFNHILKEMKQGNS